MSNLSEAWTESASTRGRLLLKLATVVVPLALLLAVILVGHFIQHALRTTVGMLALLALASPAVVLFSYWVFGRIESAEARAASNHRQLLLLNSVAAAASRPIGLDELLQRALDGVVDGFPGVHSGLVCELDEENRELRHVACRNVPDHLLGPLKRVKLEDDRIGAEVVRDGRPVYIPDTRLDTRLSEKAIRANFRSLLSLPLISEGKVRGVMALTSTTPDAFDGPEIASLLILSGQLAAAMERAALHQQVADFAVLEERERIAREMHDGLAQVLGYINAQTSAINRLLADGNVGAAREEVEGLRKAARDVYEDVRQSILGLRLAGAPLGSPSASLHEYAESFADLSGIDVTVEGLDGEGGLDLDAAVEIQTLRIIQEALTNVRKHSKAKHVYLGAARKNGWLRMVVRDDGVGFDPTFVDDPGRGHFGLKTMVERANGVGGSVDIETEHGSGTAVTLTVPTRHMGS